MIEYEAPLRIADLSAAGKKIVMEYDEFDIPLSETILIDVGPSNATLRQTQDGRP